MHFDSVDDLVEKMDAVMDDTILREKEKRSFLIPLPVKGAPAVPEAPADGQEFNDYGELTEAWLPKKTPIGQCIVLYADKTGKLFCPLANEERRFRSREQLKEALKEGF